MENLIIRAAHFNYQDDLNLVHWHYAHGHLENVLGTDLIVSNYEIEPKPGDIIPVRVEHEGASIEALLFSWSVYGRSIPFGIVVAKSDSESLKDVVLAYSEGRPL